MDKALRVILFTFVGLIVGGIIGYLGTIITLTIFNADEAFLAIFITTPLTSIIFGIGGLLLGLGHQNGVIGSVLGASIASVMLPSDLLFDSIIINIMGSQFIRSPLLGLINIFILAFIGYLLDVGIRKLTKKNSQE